MKIEIAALRGVAATHRVPVEEVTDAVVDALNVAYATAHKDTPDRIEIDADGTVVLVTPDGDRSEPAGFGRIAVAAMRQAVVSWVRDQERRAVVGPWAAREGRPYPARVSGFGKAGEVRLRIEDVNAVLPAGEQIPTEDLTEGQTVTVLVLAANADDSGRIKLTVSRRQPALVTALLEASGPALSSGKVRVVAVSREPGIRTKVAVTADAGVDPVAELVGAGGFRMRTVQDALGTERVDLVVHDPDPAAFVAAALTPARRVVAAVSETTARTVVARVPVDQMELATGTQGINVRLAQRLTGSKIQLVPTS